MKRKYVTVPMPVAIGTLLLDVLLLGIWIGEFL